MSGPYKIMKLSALSIAIAASSPFAQAQELQTLEKAVVGNQEQVYQNGNMDLTRSSDDIQAYTVIDADAIKKSGASNVMDLLRQQLPMSTSVVAESASGWGGTSSQINLRGLGTENTLVLINGRRGSGQGNTRNGVSLNAQQDISNIPLAAIDRIEVLPTSASAIYGSNAIGGVINVVLKRDYVGSEINMRYEDTDDIAGANKRISLTSGFALENGKTQIMISAQVQRQDPLNYDERDFMVDRRNRILAVDPDTFYSNELSEITNRGRGTGDFSVINPPFGNLVNIRTVDGSALIDSTANSSSFAYLPAGYAGVTVDGLQPIIDNLGQYALGINPGHGTYRGNESLVGDNESNSISLGINRDFTDNLNVYLDASYDNSVSKGVGVMYRGWSVAKVEANAPTNPFGKAVNVAAPYLYHGDWRSAETKNKRAALGFSYDLSEWLINFDYAYSESERGTKTLRDITTGNDNYTISDAINDGTENVFLDTTTLAFAIQLSPYFDNAVAVNANKLEDITLRAVGPIMSWAAGDIQLATGLEHREMEVEGHNERTTVLNYGAQDIDSLYAELSLPVISPSMNVPGVHSFNMQFAARHERFSMNANDGATRAKISATTPTFGMSYAPIADLMFRASYGEGFIAPTVNQIAIPELEAELEGTGTDPLRGDELIIEYDRITGGNPSLEPETSESINYGLVYTPSVVPGLRLSLDFYDIEKSNNITSLSENYILENQDIYGGRITRASAIQGDGFTVGPITAINSTPTNALNLKTSGFDAAISYQAPTSLGYLSVHFAYTHVNEYSQQEALNTAANELAGLSARIKDRASSLISLDINDTWTLGWNVEYYGSYKFEDGDDYSVLLQGSDGIDSQIYHDIYAYVKLPFANDAQLSLSIQNVFDDYAVDYSSSSSISRYSDPRLRNFNIGLKVAF